MREIDLIAAALDAGDRDFLRAALGVVEDDGIDDRATGTLGGLEDTDGARHVGPDGTINSGAPAARRHRRAHRPAA